MIRGILSKNEIVPDSEQERVRVTLDRRRYRYRRRVRESYVDEEVIDIPSSDDDQSTHPLPPTKTGADKLHVSRPPNKYTPPPKPESSSRSTSPTKKYRPPRTPRARRIIESSDSENDAGSNDEVGAILAPRPLPPAFSVTSRRSIVPQDVIELTDSEPEPIGEKNRPTSVVQENAPPWTSTKSIAGPSLEVLAREDNIKLSTGGEDLSETDDGAIIHFYEPRSARRPIKVLPPAANPKSPTPLSKVNSVYSAPSPKYHCLSDDEATVVTGQTPFITPALARIRSEYDTFNTPSPSVSLPSTPSTPTGRSTKKTSTKTPRVTKRAAAAAEHARLDKYAHDLFAELNRAVFDGGIPKETKLMWNSRLLTTAGKARWQRNRDGVNTVIIELAPKVLDSEERIRHTLSHEMCHLASWLISNAPNENHGKVFKFWGKKVMRKRSDIEVSTRHDYDIRYRYEWKCAECAKVYGRHSKSIKPDEVVCGACHKGKLIPQFTTRAPKTPKKPQSGPNTDPARDLPKAVQQSKEIISLDDSDDDVQEITKRLETTIIYEDE